MVPKLSPKIVSINSGLKVIGYASEKNEALFLQAIDNGMYEMERREGHGLNADDDSGMIRNLDEDEDETMKEVTLMRWLLWKRLHCWTQVVIHSMV